MRAETAISVLDLRKKNAHVAVPCGWASKAVPHVLQAIGSASVDIKRGVSPQIGFAESYTTPVALTAGVNDEIDITAQAWLFYHVTTADSGAKPVKIETLLTHVEGEAGGGGVTE